VTERRKQLAELTERQTQRREKLRRANERLAEEIASIIGKK